MTTQTDPNWPQWVIRQNQACVRVQAPWAEAAIEIVAERLGHMGGWKTGPGLQQEVLARGEYRDHTKPGDYTRAVVIAPERTR